MKVEKLTVRKVLTIVVLTSLGVTALCLLYLGILIFSLPLTLNMTTSWILSLSITMGILFCLGYVLKKHFRRVVKK